MDIELSNNHREEKNLDEDIKLKEQKVNNLQNSENNIDTNQINKDKKNGTSSEHEEKKPLEDNTSFSKNFKDKTEKYFDDLVNYHKIKKRKVFLEKKVKTWIIVIYYLLSSFTNIISVLLFIIDSQMSDNSTSKYSLLVIDFSIAIFFTLEFIQSFIISEKKMTHFFRIDTIIDAITIIPSYINFLVSKVSIQLSFMRIFRVLRVLRVLRLLKYVKMLKSDDESEMESSNTSGFRINKVKKQIISFIVSLVSTIFVSAGTVTILQTYIPNSFNVSNLTFIDAVYFVIVTSSTLGYGDIVPTNTISRMLVIILLIFLIYFFSEQIASIVSLLRISDNTEISFEFEKHNIIIGDLSVDGIKSFLDEFYDIFNFNSKIKNKPNTIIMLDEKNSKIKENLSLEPYENKVHFLVTKTYSIEAFIKSSFDEADTIICLNQNYKSNPWITDKINDFTLKNIKDFNKSNTLHTEKKKLYLQSLILREKIESKRLTPVLNFQILKLKSCLIAKSIYCKGFLSFITNLTIRKFPQLNVKNELINNYVRGMENCIVIATIPKKLRDLEFGVLFREIYFKSVNKFPSVFTVENQHEIHVGNNPHTNYMNSIPSREDEKKFLEMQRSKLTNYERERPEDLKSETGIILLGILQQKYNQEKLKEFEEQIKEPIKEAIDRDIGNNVDKILYNPINYKIGENDLGIFVTSLSREEIEAFLENVEPPNEIERKGTIANMSRNNDAIQKHLKQDAKENYKKNITYITKQHSKLKFLEPSSRFIEADLFTTNITNQIMIFGFPSYIEEIISKIRSQNLYNPILILAENFDEELKQKILKKFSNLYLVLGDFLDLKTLENVKTENSMFIVILSTENINTINEDSNAVLAARIIEQYFQIPFIVEVFDNVNSRFLGSLPFLNDNLADELTEFIYPNYMQGKIFFTSFLDKLLPRSFSSLQEVICIQELIENDFKSEEEVYENEDNHDDLEIKLYTKTSYHFFTIKIPSHLIGRPYFELFDELTNMKDLHIPLGIYGIREKKDSDKDSSNKVLEKCEKCRNCRDCKNDEILCDKCKNCLNCNNYQDLENNYLLNKYLNIINNEIKNNVLEYVYIENITTPLFITNPPINFILEKDMEVLVLGKFNKMIDSEYTGDKQGLKKMSKFDKISEDIMNFSQKKDIVKKFEKYLHKRINQIELQNFE